jgi:hypothetical protein
VGQQWGPDDVSSLRAAHVKVQNILGVRDVNEGRFSQRPRVRDVAPRTLTQRSVSTLGVVEENAQATGSFLQDPQSGLAKATGARDLSGGQAAAVMRLLGGVSCAGGAFLFRSRSAHRATRQNYGR